MKATAICHSAAIVEELRKRAAAEGVDIAAVIQRKPHEPLKPLLEKASGEMLMIECGQGTLDADLPALEELTRVNPQLPVLMLCAQQDSASLLAAMRAGVREVLPAQPGEAELAAALRRITQRTLPAKGAAHGRVIAFLPCKGGSGATFMATNIAWCLATQFERRTALLDLDLQYGDAAYFVSDGHGRSSLAELARQVDRLDASLLDSSMISVAPNFKLLPAPEEPEAALGVTGLQLEHLIDVAQAAYDFVVLDVERMLDPISIKALDKADTIFLVTENMVPHTRDAKRLVRILHALGYGGPKLQLLVNRYQKHIGIEIEKLESIVGLKAAHVIRDSAAEVAEAVNTGVPLGQIHPGNPVAREFGAIAASLADVHPAHHGWLDRLIRAEA